ncbi:hypothetical protein NLI96_g2672 [Meripilus lineatus]|uniref:Sucrase n=1 Tax=Meripilus lineatus TaxID=2056292 RepID=A0AAD5VAE1_9APHY|nr:hypothetical protein NLI96_g2672 [Physisporinus lineatus]
MGVGESSGLVSPPFESLDGQSDIQASAEELRNASVPVSEAGCRNCADPCDQGHEEYPDRFDVDRETQMYGSVKPYRRQVIISTGKSDWAFDIAFESGSLASYLSSASGSTPKPKKQKTEGGGSNGTSPQVNGKEKDKANEKDKNKDKDKEKEKEKPKKPDPGTFNTSTAKRISILNGSHHTVCDDVKRESVLVFPDYKLVTEVERSKQGAAQLWRAAVSPAVGRAGEILGDESPIRSWVLPYSCVILLCSHKRRDNRCAISAPILEEGFTTSLEREGWEVHRQLEDPSHHGQPLEEFKGTDDEREAEVIRQLKQLDPSTVDTKRALILRNSHIGGHKFAGNCIIYTPHGAAVWYGRVTPHNIDPIVKETIIDGKVLPEFLRGGANISQPGHESLYQW